MLDLAVEYIKDLQSQVQVHIFKSLSYLFFYFTEKRSLDKDLPSALSFNPNIFQTLDDSRAKCTCSIEPQKEQ